MVAPAQSRGNVQEKGLKTGALGLVSSVVIGVASTAPAYSLAATLGFIVARRRPAVAGHRDPGLRPDAVHRDRLPGTEQGRPRLRHHLHLGDPRVRAEDRLARRLGHPGRRHPRHGQPGPGRRPVRLPAVQRRRHRQRPDQRLGAARGRAVDRADDLHLLRRCRAVGQAAAGAADHRADHAAVFSVVALVKVGTSNGTAGSIGVSLSWFNPLHIPTSRRSSAACC